MIPQVEDSHGFKSYFLGPQSENGAWASAQIKGLLDHYLAWRQARFPADGPIITADDQQNEQFQRFQTVTTRELKILMERLESETPKFSPRYIGHMISETALPALLGHFLLMLHNPNNASSEVARVSNLIEREAISMMLKMIGMSPESGRGHFTSGGTIANFESLWRARYRLDHWFSLGAMLRSRGLSKSNWFELSHMGWKRFHNEKRNLEVNDEELRRFSWVEQSPWQFSDRIKSEAGIHFAGPIVLVPGHRHYSWQKGISLLGLGNQSFWPVDLDRRGKMSLTSLRANVEKARIHDRPILSIVSVCGTTELGEIDPIHEIQNYLDELKTREDIHIWHHVDGAYGAFFACIADRADSSELLAADDLSALRSLGRVDSVTIDPHKLGYVPYACGAILLPDEEHNYVSSFRASYLGDAKDEVVQWNNVLEGSRSGTGAAATWMCGRTIGFNANGYGLLLKKGIEARRLLELALLDRVAFCRIIPDLDTNILCFCIAKKGEPVSVANARSLAVHDILHQGPRFGVSKTKLHMSDYSMLCESFVETWNGSIDTEGVVLLRLTLMNPFLTSKNKEFDYISGFAEEVRKICSLFT